MRRVVLIFLFLWMGGFAQERPIFTRFDKTALQEYNQKYRAIENSVTSLDIQLDKKIELATTYNHYDDLIESLEEKIDLGETAELRYYLGGINGLKALSVYRLFALPYVRSMLNNFKRSLELNPNYTPAIEAYVESLCLVPSIIGGDLKKALQLSEHLLQLNTIEGYFSKGFIAKSKGEDEAARVAYAKAFKELEKQEFCTSDKEVFFKNKSLNFSFKIAEVSSQYGLSPSIGLCAINYFIEHKSYLYNIPLEWAYYRKAELHLLLNDLEAAKAAIDEALTIKPDFEKASALIENKIE